MEKVRNVSLLDTVRILRHINSIIPSPRSMLSTKMLSSRKKRLGMVALIKLFQGELKYPIKMMMEMRRLYRVDS
jgi:hypothetical protein